MRFRERHIRVNRQELDSDRKDETTKLRQFAKEREIASNCIKLCPCIGGEVGYSAERRVSSVFIVLTWSSWWGFLVRMWRDCPEGDKDFEICMAIGSSTRTYLFFYNLMWLNETFLSCATAACVQDWAKGEKVYEGCTWWYILANLWYIKTGVGSMACLRPACMWLLDFYLSKGYGLAQLQQIVCIIICMSARKCPSHTGPLMSVKSL